MTPRPAILRSGFSGRAWLFLFIGLGAAIIGWLLQTGGWDRTWQHWHLPLRGSNFADLRVITGAATSAKAGLDPMIQNPYDIYHQPFNYPRIWLLFIRPGLSDGAVYALAITWIAAFLLGLWWLTKDISKTEALYVGLLIGSPAVMLGVERANSDLLMFFLLALACVAVERSIVVALATVLLAFAFKLYPLAGLSLLLREPRTRALRLGGAALALVAVYLASNATDIVKICRATERGDLSSYGINTLWMLVSHFSPDLGLAIRGFAYCAVVVSFAAAWLVYRKPADKPAGRPARPLDAYRVGASVYAGTFLLGNNWDYRLIFLLFLVPQLFSWVRTGSPSLRWLAISQLVAIVGAMWAMHFLYWLLFLPHSYLYARTLEELANSWLFLGSLCLLAMTLPDWMRLRSPGPASAQANTPR